MNTEDVRDRGLAQWLERGEETFTVADGHLRRTLLKVEVRQGVQAILSSVSHLPEAGTLEGAGPLDHLRNLTLGGVIIESTGELIEVDVGTAIAMGFPPEACESRSLRDAKRLIAKGLRATMEVRPAAPGDGADDLYARHGTTISQLMYFAAKNGEEGLPVIVERLQAGFTIGRVADLLSDSDALDFLERGDAAVSDICAREREAGDLSEIARAISEGRAREERIARAYLEACRCTDPQVVAARKAFRSLEAALSDGRVRGPESTVSLHIAGRAAAVRYEADEALLALGYLCPGEPLAVIHPQVPGERAFPLSIERITYGGRTIHEGAVAPGTAEITAALANRAAGHAARPRRPSL